MYRGCLLSLNTNLQRSMLGTMPKYLQSIKKYMNILHALGIICLGHIECSTNMAIKKRCRGQLKSTLKVSLKITNSHCRARTILSLGLGDLMSQMGMSPYSLIAAMAKCSFKLQISSRHGYISLSPRSSIKRDYHKNY